MRIGIIADIHEDIASLRKALKYLKKIGSDHFVCLGDIVGLPASMNRLVSNRKVNECITLVKRKCSITVVGNHDLFSIKKLPEYEANFYYPDDWYDLNFDVRSKLSKGKIWIYDDNNLNNILSEESKKFIDSLPEYFILDCGEYNILFSHYNYPDLTGSTINFSENIEHLKEHFNFMNEKNCLLSFSGHGHSRGCIIAQENIFKKNNFGLYKLKKNFQWIDAPCIVNSSKQNGVMIFDTKSFFLDVIPL